MFIGGMFTIPKRAIYGIVLTCFNHILVGGLEHVFIFPFSWEQ